MRCKTSDFLPCSTSKPVYSSTQKFRLKVQFQFGAEPGQQKNEAAGSTASLSIVIVAFTLIDFNLSIDHAINKPVRIVNASAPIA